MPLPSTCYMDTPRKLVLPTVVLGAKGPIQTIGTEVTVQDWLNLGQQIKDQSSKGLPISLWALPPFLVAGRKWQGEAALCAFCSHHLRCPWQHSAIRLQMQAE